MRIDRQRALIDLVTALVPVVVLAAAALWLLRIDPESGITRRDVLGAYGEFVLMGVGPQVVQAVVGQLLFRRVDLAPWVRGVIMIQVWFHSLVLGMWFLVLAPTLWAVYIGLYITVPLLAVTRLVVRTIVRARAGRTVIGRGRRTHGGAVRPAAR